MWSISWTTMGQCGDSGTVVGHPSAILTIFGLLSTQNYVAYAVAREMDGYVLRTYISDAWKEETGRDTL